MYVAPKLDKANYATRYSSHQKSPKHLYGFRNNFGDLTTMKNYLSINTKLIRTSPVAT